MVVVFKLWGLHLGLLGRRWELGFLWLWGLGTGVTLLGLFTFGALVGLGDPSLFWGRW